MDGGVHSAGSRTTPSVTHMLASSVGCRDHSEETISFGPMRQGVGTAGLGLDAASPTLVSHCVTYGRFLEMHVCGQTPWVCKHSRPGPTDESPACVNCEEMAGDLSPLHSDCEGVRRVGQRLSSLITPVGGPGPGFFLFGLRPHGSVYQRLA